MSTTVTMVAPPTGKNKSKSGSSNSAAKIYHLDTTVPKNLTVQSGSSNSSANSMNMPSKQRSAGMHNGEKDIEMASLLPSTASSGNQQGNDQPSSKSISPALSSIFNAKITLACGLYSFCSVSMVLTNKSLASSYNHLIDGDLNILLVVFQAIVAVICVEACKQLKWVEYPALTLETAKQWAPVNIFFCLMLFTGMASLQYNSVPMVTIFKNITNIVVTFGDYICFGSAAERLVIVAFGIMLSGAIAAAWNDITISFLGLFWMVLNCFSTAGYVLYMKYATKHVKLSKFGMVFVNNVLCVVFLLPCSLLMGQLSILLDTPAIHTWDYTTKNIFAGFIGFFLNFASLNCVAATGPTTYAIVGSLNKVPVAFLGYALFDNVISSETWFFIAISMAGGFLYSFAKIQSSRKKATSEQATK